MLTDKLLLDCDHDSSPALVTVSIFLPSRDLLGLCPFSLSKDKEARLDDSFSRVAVPRTS